jgi:hypothetical protein
MVKDVHINNPKSLQGSISNLTLKQAARKVYGFRVIIRFIACAGQHGATLMTLPGVEPFEQLFLVLIRVTLL